ncbi:hypothetical protein FCV25MIE_33332, partial [Fagus crenata]
MLGQKNDSHREQLKSRRIASKLYSESKLVNDADACSVILMKKRRMAEMIPPSWRKVWKEWELRGLILLSLTAQIVLVVLGNRKNHEGGIWRRVTVWSAYLLADSIAMMTAGILSNDLGEVYMDTGFLDANSELTAFWAPIMLLHLGGPDTITAYSLEDNELWRRHLLGIVSQAMTTLYIMFMAWTGSRFSLLFVVMFCVGLVKYCERVWVLYWASDNKFRDSIPDIPTNDSVLMKEYRLKELEGYHLRTHQVLEVPDDHLGNAPSSADDNDAANELRTAYSLREMVKRLFADMILSFKDRDASTAIFTRHNMTCEKAFRVIEIELGYIYDLLYTKANVIHSSWGIGRRVIGFFLTFFVLVVLSLDKMVRVREKQQYPKIDFTITLLLLAVSLLLELYSLLELLLSDQTAHWLIKHKKTTILRVINCCAPKKRRWSNSVAQLSLLSLSLRQNPVPCRAILKMLRIDQMLEIYWNETSVPLTDIFKRFIFNEIMDVRWSSMRTNCSDTDLKALYSLRGGRTLKKYKLDDLDWSVKLDFDQSILVWHLATEICCNLEKEPEIDVTAKTCKYLSPYLSRYMLYLLVRHPYMLPIGMAHIRFQEIYTEVGRFIEEELDESVEKVCEIASEMLKKAKVVTARENRAYFVIFHACKLVSILETHKEKFNMWNVLFAFWIEILAHAAIQCKGRHHAQQLRRGGELITHIWLLMAHLGLTDHFQIPVTRATSVT